MLAGVVSGEGHAAYLSVRDTTSPGYWVAQMAVGLVVLAFVGQRTTSGRAVVTFAVAVAALLATRVVPLF